MDESVIANGLTVLLTALAMVGVKYLFPSRLDPDGPSLKDLEFEYRRWALVGVPVVLLAMCGCGAAWFFGLRSAAGATIVDLPKEVWIRPGTPVFGIASLALGFSCGVLLTYLLYWVLLRDRFAEFCRYDELAAGYSTLQFLSWFCVLFAGFGIALAVASSDWEIGFTPQAITINPAIGATQQYAYNDVVEVKSSPFFVAPNGRQVPRWKAVISFRDGARWGSQDSPDDLSEQDYIALFDLVAKRAGMMVKHVPVLRREDL